MHFARRSGSSVVCVASMVAHSHGLCSHAKWEARKLLERRAGSIGVGSSAVQLSLPSLCEGCERARFRVYGRPQ